MMSSLVSTLLFFIGILLMHLALKKWKKIDVGRWGLLGMALILSHQTRDLPVSAWAIYGLAASVLGIFCIVIGVVKAVEGARAKDPQKGTLD
jgi:uncharacterized Tic20 family protein